MVHPSWCLIFFPVPPVFPEKKQSSHRFDQLPVSLSAYLRKYSNVKQLVCKITSFSPVFLVWVVQGRFSFSLLPGFIPIVVWGSPHFRFVGCSFGLGDAKVKRESKWNPTDFVLFSDGVWHHQRGTSVSDFSPSTVFLEKSIINGNA